jgi:hypothetical protein
MVNWPRIMYVLYLVSPVPQTRMAGLQSRLKVEHDDMTCENKWYWSVQHYDWLRSKGLQSGRVVTPHHVIRNLKWNGSFIECSLSEAAGIYRFHHWFSVLPPQPTGTAALLVRDCFCNFRLLAFKIDWITQRWSRRLKLFPWIPKTLK